MVAIGSLWTAIIVAAVLVFLASTLVWMVLPHHKKEFKAVPNEEGARAALANLSPGQYNIPHMEKRSDADTPEGKKKFEEGPNILMNVLPRGVPKMGKQLLVWFIYCIVTGIVVAYVTGRTVPAGAEYLTVYRVAGTTAWLAFGWGVIPEAIFFGRPWSAVIKHLADAFFYALMVGGAFGWLWPGA